MIQISQLKLPIDHTEEQLTEKIRRVLRLPAGQKFSYEIVRQSLDARKKEEKRFSYCIHVKTNREDRVLRKVANNNIMSIQARPYRFPEPGEEPLAHRPVIAGSGPAGLFCGYMLARCGYRPLILERGEEVQARRRKVEEFWASGRLDSRCNVQFGEGGAGTFSDGKLNTRVKDPEGRIREVLRIFVECGAPPEILYQQKPHLGTDALIGIVENLRGKIQDCGGEFRFLSQVTDIGIREGRIRHVEVNGARRLDTDVLVLAIGHSARDTYQMLYDKGLAMTRKSFAVGVRVEHPQEMINRALYGEPENPILGAASYKLTARTSRGRGAYTFCMCPGGYVVDASSEPGHLAVNGMSYRDRGSDNANSAVIVTVDPEDFGSEHPLAGIAYQRRLERAAYRLAEGCVPVQLFGDFRRGEASEALGGISPCIRGRWRLADVSSILPDYIRDGICEAMESFAGKIPGFDREDALLCGVESRTSSPVRILRDGNFESSAGGIYPCGEGAGYAGGITSAAADGIRTAEKIALRFHPLQEKSREINW